MSPDADPHPVHWMPRTCSCRHRGPRFGTDAVIPEPAVGHEGRRRVSCYSTHSPRLPMEGSSECVALASPETDIGTYDDHLSFYGRPLYSPILDPARDFHPRILDQKEKEDERQLHLTRRGRIRWMAWHPLPPLPHPRDDDGDESCCCYCFLHCCWRNCCCRCCHVCCVTCCRRG